MKSIVNTTYRAKTGLYYLGKMLTAHGGIFCVGDRKVLVGMTA
ncbi:hypothetical protein [Cyanobacterium sp. Dongsha4]|nr:hypothetical protein [Cyanobacterium sp. Dongsha4]